MAQTLNEICRKAYFMDDRFETKCVDQFVLNLDTDQGKEYTNLSHIDGGIYNTVSNISYHFELLDYSDLRYTNSRLPGLLISSK